MIIEVVKKIAVEVTKLRVKAGVRYWNDATLNGAEPVDDDNDDGTVNQNFPCREGNYWCPEIDLETGIILNWEKGTTAEIHFKVCDDGFYQLLDSNDVVQHEHEGYVPNMMCPEENGYGDYIIMNVSEKGKIDKFNFSLSGFETED